MDGGAVMVQGEALGVAFDLLLTSVVDASKKVAGFTSQLNRFKSTLCSIKPAIDDIDTLNGILDRPRHETEAFTARLMRAEQLVRRCSEVSKWNVLMRLYYSNKLSKLETSLLNFFQINVAALHLCETKRISVIVRGLQEKLNEIAEEMSKKTAVEENEGLLVEENEGLLVEENDEISFVVMEK